MKLYSSEALSKKFPEKTRPQGFSHPLFQCPDMSPSPTNPSSVEQVKAADIRAIAALGDSLTTAIGANASSVLEIPIEYRQVSFSIGGYGTFQDVITLANIVKLFNPKVLGPAPIQTLNGLPATINETGFNLAVTGHNTLNFSEQARHLIDTFKSYPRRLEQLLHSDRYFKEDFAVVLQPFAEKAQPPRLPNGDIDVSFFAPDCFHFTIKGHEELAKGLWNNMFQPAGEKGMIEEFSEPVKLICPPKEHPYIYTRPKVAGPSSTSPTLSGLLHTWLFLSLLAMACVL
ncbi:hypothetical protein GJAV_G00011900 [Gymnothorax javanicus]|nr:hypothetical protein GJAV_G00011900 [Gymnothorax javanicus]